MVKSLHSWWIGESERALNPGNAALLVEIKIEEFLMKGKIV